MNKTSGAAYWGPGHPSWPERRPVQVWPSKTHMWRWLRDLGGEAAVEPCRRCGSVLGPMCDCDPRSPQPSGDTKGGTDLRSVRSFVDQAIRDPAGYAAERDEA